MKRERSVTQRVREYYWTCDRCGAEAGEFQKVALSMYQITADESGAMGEQHESMDLCPRCKAAVDECLLYARYGKDQQ